ncbi:MAG: DUF4097 family beta strand repeat-containing protein [Vicinamibacteria bacterium]
MTMRRTFTAAAIAASTLALSPSLLAADFEWKGRLAAGRTLEIKGVNGSIEAQPASSGEIEVTARKTARRSDPESVEIEVVEHAEGVTICAVYPTPAGSSRENACASGGGGRMSTRDNDVKVDFTVRVPAGVKFAGSTVNGEIDAGPLDADAELQTVNGSIRASSKGIVRAETVNGSIDARMGRADWTGDLELQTVNGSVTVELPASASADVTAKTVNGDIETDFPLTVRGRISRRSVSGTIGGGGRSLEIETVNGGIRLRKQ